MSAGTSNSAIPLGNDPIARSGRFVRLFADRSLRFKLILAFLVVTVLSIGAVAYFTSRATQTALTKGVGDSIHSQAVLKAQAIGDLLMRQIDTIQSFALSMLVNYVRTGTEQVTPAADARVPPAGREMSASLLDESKAVRFRFTGYSKFLDPDGYPAVAPPWGTLNAIDLNTGRYRWKIPFGEYPELAARGMSNTGSENYGGPIVTAGGLLFIGATVYDHKLRAFDSSNGKLLWEYALPYAGTATPATYLIDGRQYVVIATSNARNPRAAQGGAYVAFTLR